MITALIPLRAGSKSIPNKNIREIAGKPLCAWVLEAACRAERIDKVYVSTESSMIADIVESLGLDITVVRRPDALATDTASTEDVMLHFADTVPFTTVCTIQATSPLLESSALDEAIHLYEDGAYDSLLTAVRCKRFFWADDFTPINYNPRSRPRRQDFAGTLMENGAFYLSRRPILTNYGCRLGGRTAVYEMSDETALEIDEPSDWTIVERLLLERGTRS